MNRSGVEKKEDGGECKKNKLFCIESFLLRYERATTICFWRQNDLQKMARNEVEAVKIRNKKSISGDVFRETGLSNVETFRPVNMTFSQNFN